MSKEKLNSLIKIGKEITAGQHGFERKDIAHYILLATAQAKCLGYDTVSLFEFGVGGGGGLLRICNTAKKLTELCGMKYKIYGFDRGIGLPSVIDYRDHPEIWWGGKYQMDYPSLKRKLPPNCELIIGDIHNTLPKFMERTDVPPIGFVSLDVDLYTSTRDCMPFFEQDSSKYLPSVLTYVDDADLVLTISEWTGQRLALNEFNERNEFRKIEKKDIVYNRMYVCQVLDHPVRHGKQKPQIPFIITYHEFIGARLL
jgi:hypothetical protein